MTVKTLIIDDDPDIRESLEIALSLQLRNLDIVSAPNGESGLQLLAEQAPDLVLLDVTMPGLSGFEVLREIRRQSDVPVILLTGRDQELERVRGLESGADDYVTKPFGHQELVARIRAVMRRSTSRAPVRQEPSIQTGDLSIHFENQEVTRGGRPVRLSPVEYRLLEILARNAGRIVPTNLLFERIWGESRPVEDDYVKVYINRLRRKVEADPRRPRYILTERGYGYRLVRDILTGAADSPPST